MHVVNNSLGRAWLPRSTFALVLGVVLMLPSGVLAQGIDSKEPIAPPKDDAPEKKGIKELMRDGIAAFRKKNFESARSAFAKAWQIEQHTEIAAALAEVEMQLGLYRDAAEHLEYNLAHGAADREEANAQLAECRKHIGRVRVEVDPPEADVLVDSVANAPKSGAARDRAFWFDPGEHALIARYAARSSPEIKVSVVAGGEQTIRLSVPAPLVAPASPTPVAAKPAPPAASARQWDGGRGVEARTVVVISGAALTVVALGVGVYGELRARAADNRRLELIDEARATLPASGPGNQVCFRAPEMPAVPSQCPEISSKVDEAIAFQKLRNASFIASGALGAVTIATYLLWPKAQRKAEQAGLVIAPLDVAQSRGVQVWVSF